MLCLGTELAARLICLKLLVSTPEVTCQARCPLELVQRAKVTLLVPLLWKPTLTSCAPLSVKLRSVLATAQLFHMLYMSTANFLS